MVTPTLQGIIGNGPFHWRGDRDDLEEFNMTYTDLLGDDEELTKEEMRQFKEYLATVYFPPNPFRNLDGTLPEEVSLPGEVATGRFALKAGEPLPAGNAKRGQKIFQPRSFTLFLPDDRIELGFLGGRSCTQCHGSGLSGGYYHGRNSDLVTEMAETTLEVARPPTLRNLYEKIGYGSQGRSLTGFGLLHDGSMDSVSRYLTQPLFDLDSDQEVADVIAFMYSLNGDTFDGAGSAFSRPSSRLGTFIQMGNAYDVHPASGRQIDVESIRRNPLTVFSLFGVLNMVEESGGAVEAVLHGRHSSGEQRTWHYDPLQQQFDPDSLLEGPMAIAPMLNRQDVSGLTLTLLPHRSTSRYGGDLDGDGLPNFDETRDLDPTAEGVQNPFDPNLADSTGDNRLTEPDGVRDDENDFDGDGLSNYEELRRGRNPIGFGPLGGQRGLALDIRPAENATDYELEFRAFSGRSYEVESSHDLRIWNRVANGRIRVHSSGRHHWRLPSHTIEAPNPRYYRVRQIDYVLASFQGFLPGLTVPVFKGQK